MPETKLESLEELVFYIVKNTEDTEITAKAIELHNLIRQKLIDRGSEIEEKIKNRNIAQKKSK